MYKTVSPLDWNGFGDNGICHIVPIGSKGLGEQDGRMFLQKTAASEKFLHEMREVKLGDGDIPVHINAIGSGEFYGCFVAGTLVGLANGWYYPIEHIPCGFEVVSGDGNIREVITTFKRHADSTLRIDASGIASDIVCTPNHPFIIAKREQFVCRRDKYKHCYPVNFGKTNMCRRNTKRSPLRSCVAAGYPEIKVERVEASELRVGDFFIWELPKIDPWMDINVHEGYLLGAWLAEGSFLYNPHNDALRKDERVVHSISLALSEYEFDFADKLKECAAALNWESHEYFYYRKNSGKLLRGRKIRANERNHLINVSGAPNRFRTWQFHFHSGSHDKRVPPWVCCLPKATKLAILAGYIDGDGTSMVNDKENRVTISTVSRHLALGVQQLFWSLGICAVVCPSRTVPGWHISVATNALSEVQPFSWKIRSRKLRQLSPTHGFFHDGRMYIPIRKITKEGPSAVYNLEIDEDHTYTVFNVATKNCNRKGDNFSAQTCRNWHHTFVTEGRNYSHHVNTDKNNSYGKIASSCFNEDLGRIEILAISNGNESAAKRNGGKVLPDEFLSKLEKNAEVPVSMGCTIKFDACGLCGNKAKNRSEYCDENTCLDPKTGEYFFGCKHGLMKMASDGRLQYVDNIEPHFFDISYVGIPADRSAYGFRATYLEGDKPEKTAEYGSLQNQFGISAPTGWTHSYKHEIQTMLSKLAAYERACESGQDIEYCYGVRALPSDIELGLKLASIPPNGRLDGLLSLSKEGILLSPLSFATAFGFSKEAASNIPSNSDWIYTCLSNHPNKTTTVAMLQGMDKAAEWKLASLYFSPATIQKYRITPERIRQHVIQGTLQYATNKTASAKNDSYREFATQYAIYKTGALCRFPQQLQPFGVRLAVWQTLSPKFSNLGR